jgi:Helix-turn-helix domain
LSRDGGRFEGNATMGEIVPIRSGAALAPQGQASLDVRASDPVAVERRRAWGRSLRDLRAARGLTMRALAETLALPHPALIGAIEAGRGRLPEGVIRSWAEALGVEPMAFARAYLMAHEPEAYALVTAEAP